MSAPKSSRDPRGIYASRIMALIVRHSSEQKPLPTIPEMARAMHMQLQEFAREIQSLIVMGDISMRVDPLLPWHCAFRIGATLLMTPGYEEGVPPSLVPPRPPADLLLARLNELAEQGQDVPSERALAVELGITRSAVHYWIERLAQSGAILIQPRGSEAGWDTGWRDYHLVATGKIIRGPTTAPRPKATSGKAGKAPAGNPVQRALDAPTGKPAAPRVVPSPAPVKALRKRPCITCGAAFMSEGAHHRMCGTCRTRRDALPVYRIAAQ